MESPGQEFVRVMAVAEMPPTHRKPVMHNGQCVLVCKAGERYYAVSNVCSHADKPLERGRIMGTSIGCPTHGARFDLATGRALNPPAVKPIATYELRVVDGWIELALIPTAVAAAG